MPRNAVFGRRARRALRKNNLPPSRRFHTSLERLEAREMLSAEDLLVGLYAGGGVLRYDASAALPIAAQGSVAAGDHGLANVAGMAAAADGTFYASNSTAGQVAHYSNYGAYLGVFATSGVTTPGTLAFGPNGDLYVTDTSGGTVSWFNTSTGAKDGSVTLPSNDVPGGIAFAHDGSLIVGDLTSGAVLQYSGGSHTALIAAGTAVGNNTGGVFLEPAAILVENNGNLLIADSSVTNPSSHQQVVLYDAGAKTTSQLVNLSAQPRALLRAQDGNLLVGVSTDLNSTNGGAVQEYDIHTGASVRTIATGIASPGALAYTPAMLSNLLVGDFDASNVLRYDAISLAVAPGGVATGAGVAGGKTGLTQTSGVAVAPDGSFYVSSYGTSQVLHFSNDGTFLNVFAGPGSSPNINVIVPGGLAFGPNGDLYIPDLGTGTISWYNTTTGALDGSVAVPNLVGAGAFPGGIAFAKNGDLIVGNIADGSVTQFDSAGNGNTLIAPLSGVGNDPGIISQTQAFFLMPSSIVVLPNGNLLIADENYDSSNYHHQIVLYNATTGALSQFINLTTPLGTQAGHVGDFAQPESMMISNHGTLLVEVSPDHAGNGEIQEYNLSTGALIRTVASGIGTPAGLAYIRPSSLQTTPTITWANPADIPFGTAIGSTQLNATASVAGGTFSYTLADGKTPAGGAVLNAGLQTLVATYTPPAASPQPYTTAIGLVQVNVTPDTPTVTVNVASQTTYNASAVPISANVAGVGGTNIVPTTDPSLSYTYYAGTLTPVQLATATPLTGAPVNAGSYTVVATFTSGLANYANAISAPTYFTINKANATITVAPYSVTYDGNAHTATGTAIGVGGVNLASELDLSGTTHTGAATYSADPWTFAGDINYNAASGTVNDIIAKANATIVVTPYSATYDAASHTATGTATGVGGVDLTSMLNLSGTTHTGAATYSADPWTFVGDNNYNAASGTVSDLIARADATIVVVPYSVSYDGNAHSASGAATGVGGVDLTSMLNLSSTTHTNAGTYNGDGWSFSGDNNYNAANGTVNDAIAKINATIQVTPYSVNYDGTAHTATGTAVGIGGVNLTSELDLSGTTHTNAGTYNADAWSFAGDTNYNAASGTVNNAIAKINATIAVTPYSVSYDGTAHTASGTATGVGGVNLVGLLDLSGTVHTNAGTYNADVWSFAGDTNYNPASGTVDDSIAKINATIAVTPYSVTYDGQAHTATGTATGVGGVNLIGLLDLSGTTHTGAGTYNGDAWTFAGNANYNAASGAIDDAIAKANATIVVTPYNVTYDGQAHTSTGTAIGAGGVNLAGELDLSGTTHTNAGAYNGDAWTFAGDANYNSASGIVNNAIAKADATIVVTPYSVTYDGQAHTATGTATGIGGVNLAGELDLSGTAHTGAGAYSDTWNFAGDSNYNSASGIVNNAIAKADATIVVTPYSVTYDGQAHTATGAATGIGGVNLAGELDLSGTTHTGAGTYNGDAWTFAGDANYNAANGTVDNAIAKANATIVVTPYSVTYDGAAHTATGTATGVGGVNLASKLDLSGTTHTNAGTYNGDAWTFAGDANYNAANGTVDNAIAKANATIVVTPYSVTYDGAAHTAAGTATGVGGVNLASKLDLSGTSHTNAGTYSGDAWSFAGDANYNAANGTVDNAIAKANATIVVTPYSVTYDGQAHTATGTATGVGGVDLASKLDLSGTSHTNAGTYNADAWTFAGDANYNAASGTVDDTIAKANAVVVVTPYSVSYDGQAHTATGTATGVGGANLASKLDLSGTTHTNAGTYNADAWNFAGDVNFNAASGTVDDSIAKVTLTVTADNKLKTLGDANPPLTATITGFVNGETASVLSGTPSLTTPATSNSPAGNYTIVAAQGTLNAANYDFTFNNGKLAVAVNAQSNFGLTEDVYVVGSGTVVVSAADGVLANDTGSGLLTVTTGTVSGANGGTFHFAADGSFTYFPPTKFPGFDYAQYTATDAQGDQATATVNVLSQTGGLVWKLYEQVLHRDPDYTGLQGWINDFLKGGTPGDFAAGFFESTELLNQVITGYYQQYLDRAPQGDDLNFWGIKFRENGGPEQIQAQFAASDEFNALAQRQYGAFPTGWITALYERILNRAPDQAGLAFWQQKLAGGMSEYQVALSFFTSPEAFSNDIDHWFNEYLGRSPSSSELSTYVDQMLGGATDRTIEQAITNLPEFAANPPSPSTGTASRLPNYIAAVDAAFEDF